MHRRDSVSVQGFQRVRLIIGLAVAGSFGLAGCERPSPPPAQRAQALQERARALQGLSEASHGALQGAAVQSLVKDVAAYNASIGHPGVSLRRETLTEPGGVVLQSGQPSCTFRCPAFPPNPPRGRFCFLDARSYCSQLNGMSFCGYTCIFIDPAAEGAVGQ